MAERNRRDDDEANEPLEDEVFDSDDDDDEPVSRGGTATKARKAESGERPRTRKDSDRVGVFGRIGRFFREVVAELRKVIWPSRKDLLTYTTVVIVFVAVMLAIVSLLDLGFARAVLWVFGNPGDDS